ncbi:MAG: hypothetical protein ACFFD2_29495 [Promethearchaeota archaeon]
MAKTRKKELVFYIKDPKKRTQFLEIVQKKVTMVNLNVMLKIDKIRLKISGTHESIQYAVQLIKRIQKSLEN